MARGIALLEVLAAALKLGLTSFGGPTAHLAYFREEYVARRRWLDDEAYADLVALCQFLPGPASSQVGIAVGMQRAGFLGGVAAWVGFTLPSALALYGFGHVVRGFELEDAGWLRGLLLVAVAVVARAVAGMSVRLAPDRERAAIAALAAMAVLTWPTALTQAAVIVAAGIAGRYWLPRPDDTVTPPPSAGPAKLGAAWAHLGLFAALLLVLPLAGRWTGSFALDVFDGFFRAGSLVFGGGHVVLPLLQAEVVGRGWLTGEQFVAGYGAAQAVPGPLFTFAAYLGSVMGGGAMAVLATVAMFMPSFLLIAGVLPFWDRLRGQRGWRAALSGVNAAVVGLLLAAWYDPVFVKAVRGPTDMAFAIGAYALLAYWKWPPWAVVLVGAAAGAVIG